MKKSIDHLYRKINKKSAIPFVAALLQELGKQEKILVHVEPQWGYVGCITRKDKSKTYFRGVNFDLNGLGATTIARDKAYTSYFLHQYGYNVIEGKTFYSPNYAQEIKSADTPKTAYQYAQSRGFPVVVKPNNLSQGRGVCVVHDRKSFFEAVNNICKKSRVFLVQKFLQGHDYRIVVLDGEVLSAYERLPLTVIGNGKSTIDELLDLRQKEFLKMHRDTAINKADFRITTRLRRLRLNRKTILKKGEELALLDNRNLSTGGEAIDVTTTMHPYFQKLCIKIARDMGLRYCGVDIMIKNDIGKPFNIRDNNYAIIEINAAPGIDHYAQSGIQQFYLLAEMYRKILIALAKPIA